MSVDSRCSVILVLLDLTAAFDMVDHSVLPSSLKYFVRIRSTALKWLTYCLTDKFFVECHKAPFLVPFSLYMLPLVEVMSVHKVSFH